MQERPVFVHAHPNGKTYTIRCLDREGFRTGQMEAHDLGSSRPDTTIHFLGLTAEQFLMTGVNHTNGFTRAAEAIIPNNADDNNAGPDDLYVTQR